MKDSERKAMWANMRTKRFGEGLKGTRSKAQIEADYRAQVGKNYPNLNQQRINEALYSKPKYEVEKLPVVDDKGKLIGQETNYVQTIDNLPKRRFQIGHTLEEDYYEDENNVTWAYTGTKEQDWNDPNYWTKLEKPPKVEQPSKNPFENYEAWEKKPFPKTEQTGMESRASWELANMKKALTSLPLLNSNEDNERLWRVKEELKRRKNSK